MTLKMKNIRQNDTLVSNLKVEFKYSSIQLFKFSTIRALFPNCTLTLTQVLRPVSVFRPHPLPQKNVFSIYQFDYYSISSF